MEEASDCTCPVCGQRREDVAYVTPCFHQLCYGCAFRWAQQRPSCAVCGHRMETIRYSVRAEDDFLECSVPQPAEHSGCGPQDALGPAEPELLPPEHSFPHELWAAFFQEHPDDLEPLRQWLQRETAAISSSDWWDVLVVESSVLECLCTHGLREAALLQLLQALVGDLTATFVRRLITTAAALFGPELRRQQDRRDARAAGGHDGPAATPSSHQQPPASGLGRSASPAGPSAEQIPGGLRQAPGHPSTSIAASEEPQEGPGRAAAAPGQGRDSSQGRPRCPPKRRAGSSPQDSAPPRKRRPRRRH